MQVLLAEDDRAVRESLVRALGLEGYDVRAVTNGAEALDALADAPADLVLLDVSMPIIDGLTACRVLRSEQNRVPILMLTARTETKDRVAGLDAGADDYLVKPFDLDELSARIRALTRRAHGQVTTLLHRGGLTLDPAARTVALDGAPVAVAAREFALLEALVEAAGKPLSRAQLEERIYGWGEEVGSNAVEVHIHALRRKLGNERIRNLRGVGYYIPETP